MGTALHSSRSFAQTIMVSSEKTAIGREGERRERERESLRVGQWQPEDREREEDGREALEPTTRLGTDGSRKKGL